MHLWSYHSTGIDRLSPNYKDSQTCVESPEEPSPSQTRQSPHSLPANFPPGYASQRASALRLSSCPPGLTGFHQDRTSEGPQNPLQQTLVITAEPRSQRKLLALVGLCLLGTGETRATFCDFATTVITAHWLVEVFRRESIITASIMFCKNSIRNACN